MTGEVFRLKSARHYGADGSSWMDFKAHKGAVIVAAVLGTEDAKHPSEEFDLVAAMARLGYQPIADNEELARLRNIEAVAKRYVASVSGDPEPDIWDTKDGLEAEGAIKIPSDIAWKAYDDDKQEAFDRLVAILSTDTSTSENRA